MHYNRGNSYLFVNGTEIYKFKAKDFEIVASPLCLGNISKDWPVDNKKKLDFVVVFMILVLIWCNFSWRNIRHSQLFDEKKWHSVIKMLKFGKMFLFTGLALLSLTSVNLLSCISMEKNVK